MLARFAEYWRQPDHYAWMVGYLRARGLGARVRLLVASAIVSYSVLPLSMLWSPSGPNGPWTRALVAVAASSVLLGPLSSVWYCAKRAGGNRSSSEPSVAAGSSAEIRVCEPGT